MQRLMMKRTIRCNKCWLILSLVAVGLLAWAGTTQAAIYTWDTGYLDGVVTGGSGDWNTSLTTDKVWTSDGGATNVGYGTNWNDVIFQGEGGTVTTRTTAIRVYSMTFHSSYLINGTGFNIGSNKLLTVNADTEIACPILNGPGSFTKQGAGTLRLLRLR